MTKYVLVYTYNKSKQQFCQEHNFHFGAAILTNNLEEAEIFTDLDKAERKLASMNEPWDWEIWSVKQKLCLHHKSNRHKLKEEQAELKKRLAEIEKQL